MILTVERFGGNAFSASSIAYITLNGVLSMKQRSIKEYRSPTMALA